MKSFRHLHDLLKNRKSQKLTYLVLTSSKIEQKYSAQVARAEFGK